MDKTNIAAGTLNDNSCARGCIMHKDWTRENSIPFGEVDNGFPLMWSSPLACLCEYHTAIFRKDFEDIIKDISLSLNSSDSFRLVAALLSPEAYIRYKKINELREKND